MKNDIYPWSIRENYLASMYCEMAMESFYQASVNYKKIKINNFSYDSLIEYNSMNKNMVSTIIFSVMTIESFLNDYAAACLGDSDFYDNFDKLSIISKFQLIARFILKSEIDKSESYYFYLKELIRERDKLIHNKSKKYRFQGYTEEEYKEIEALHNQESMDETPLLDKDNIQENFRCSLDALKAIHKICSYFDKLDSSAWATIRLFHPDGTVMGSDTEKMYKNYIFPLLGIKVRRYK